MQPRPAIVEDVPGQTEVFLIRFIGNEVSEIEPRKPVLQACSPMIKTECVRY